MAMLHGHKKYLKGDHGEKNVENHCLKTIPVKNLRL